MSFNYINFFDLIFAEYPKYADFGIYCQKKSRFLIFFRHAIKS